MNRRSHYFLSFLAMSLFAGFSSDVRPANPAGKPSWGARAFSTKNRFVATSTLLVATPVVLALHEAIAAARTTTPAQKQKTEYLKKLAIAALKNAQSRELWQRHFGTAYAVTACFPARGAKETRKAWAIRVKNLVKIYAKTNPALATMWTLWIANIAGTAVHQTYKGACSATAALNDWIASFKGEDYGTPTPSAVPKPPRVVPPAPPVVTDDDEEANPEATAGTTKQLDGYWQELTGLKAANIEKTLTSDHIAEALESLDDPTITKPANYTELKNWLLEAQAAAPKAEPQGEGQAQSTEDQLTLAQLEAIAPCLTKANIFFTPKIREEMKKGLKSALKPLAKQQRYAHAALLWYLPVNPLNPTTYLVSIPLHTLTAATTNDAAIDAVITSAIGTAKVVATGADVARGGWQLGKWTVTTAIPTVAIGTKDVVVATSRFAGRQTVACGSRSARGANRAWRAARATFTAQNIKDAGKYAATGTARASWWGTKKLAGGGWWLIKKDADFLATNLGVKAAARAAGQAATATQEYVVPRITAAREYVAPVTEPVGSALSRFAAFMLSGKNRKSKLKPR